MENAAQLPRVGVATDIHAFSTDPHRPLMLACLEWPGEVGLEGHSDADVVAHACCDALLAAAGMGDLGIHIGVDRPQWRGASGRALLTEVVTFITAAGWRVGNVSIQVIGNKPRMGARYGECNQVMSEVVGAPVHISATTSDGLGFTGRGEGIAAIATALLTPAGNA